MPGTHLLLGRQHDTLLSEVKPHPTYSLRTNQPDSSSTYIGVCVCHFVLQPEVLCHMSSEAKGLRFFSVQFMRGRHNLIVPLSLLGLHQCQGRNTTSSDHQYFREESKLNYIENMFLKVCSIEITTTQVEGPTHKFEDRTNARVIRH